MGLGRSEVFLGDCDPNASPLAPPLLKKGVWRLEDSSRVFLIQKYWFTTFQTTMTWKIKLILAVGVTICSLNKKVLRSWDSKLSSVLGPSKVHDRMPWFQPRKASRGGYVCPSCRVQEGIWNRMFGVVSLSFPNVGQERWGLRWDSHGKLLSFSKGSTDCRFLESCSYKRGWTTMDQGLWAEPLYTCWYLFLLISTEGWRDAHSYFQYASFSGGVIPKIDSFTKDSPGGKVV